MNVKDLAPGAANGDVIIDILEKGDIREFEKFGKQGKVCSCKAQDETGSVQLTLWNEDIEKINAGDKVKITNGWVSQFQGELQISSGKFGQMEVVGKSDVQSQPGEPAPVDEPEPAGEEEDIKVEEENI